MGKRPSTKSDDDGAQIPSGQRLLNSRALSSRFGCDIKTVERRFRRGGIPHGFKLCGEWYVRETDFVDLLDALSGRGPAK